VSTSLEKEESRAAPWSGGFLSEHRVVLWGVALIVVQLAFRGWALAGSWFVYDDFNFMSRVMNSPLRQVLFTPYAGHLMPGGFLLSWVNQELAPLAFALPASELLVMQAVASFGCLAFLLTAFGSRPGILPPLAIYLFSVISLPAAVWWAAGVNQLPLHIAFFWGLYTHLSYLRTREVRYAVLTMLIVVSALLFYEKTLLLFMVFAIVAWAYFAEGDIVTRTRTIWRRYRVGVVTYAAVALAYGAVYAIWGLNFSLANANTRPLGPVFLGLGVRAFGTGILGGPLHWMHPTYIFAAAQPSDLLVLASWATIVALMFEMVRTRARAKRAWLIPAALLCSDVLLVVAARSSLPVVAQDYRYQTELAAAAAVALGLSLMPVLGAVESAERKRPSAFFDNPQRATAATVLVVCLALVSSLQYALHWQSADRQREYFANVKRSLLAEEGSVPLADTSVPGYVMVAFSAAENATSHVLRMYADYAHYPPVTTDQLYIIDRTGNVRPVVVPTVRKARRGPDWCGYAVRDAPVRIPLNGPVFGTGWWVRVGYLASGDSPVTVRAGAARYETRIYKGLHSLYFEAAGKFRAVWISGLEKGATLCTDEVTLGMPEPFIAGHR
jgi:hypothetical protein